MRYVYGKDFVVAGCNLSVKSTLIIDPGDLWLKMIDISWGKIFHPLRLAIPHFAQLSLFFYRFMLSFGTPVLRHAKSRLNPLPRPR